LFWDLHEKIKNTNGKIILFGTGNESRDFIHIEDIAQQITLAIDNADFLGEAINLANGVEVKISEVVELYQKFYPKKFEYEFSGEVRLGDPLNWCADVTLMRNWDYQNRVGIEKGIENYIKWAVCQ
jgi:dTDP-glucose 4,6-dehydratase/UDP-glucose 4-epimerase